MEQVRPLSFAATQLRHRSPEGLRSIAYTSANPGYVVQLQILIRMRPLAGHDRCLTLTSILVGCNATSLAQQPAPAVGPARPHPRSSATPAIAPPSPRSPSASASVFLSRAFTAPPLRRLRE